MTKPLATATINTSDSLGLGAIVTNAWPILETSGITVHDYVGYNGTTFDGNNITGNGYNIGNIEASLQGGGLLCQSGTGYGVIPTTNLTIGASSSWSLAFGAQLNSVAAGTYGMIFADSGDAGCYFWLTEASGTAQLKINNVSATWTVTIDEDYHDYVLSCSYSAANLTCKLYQDGTLCGTQTIAAAADAITQFLAYNGAEFPFLGTLYYLYWFGSNALSAAQAQGLATNYSTPGNPYEFFSNPALSLGTISFDLATTTSIEITGATASGGSGSGYSYQWQRAADAATWTNISGATAYASVTDTPTAQSLPYAYRLKVTDSASNVAYSNVVWGALQTAPIEVAWIGDSIWGVLNGGSGTTSPMASELVPAVAAQNLSAAYGPRSIVSANCALSGTTVADWNSASTMLTLGVGTGASETCWAYAQAAITAAGIGSSDVFYVMIMLGTNDSTQSTSAATYKSGLQTLMATIFAAYPNAIIVLNYPGVCFTGYDAYLASYWPMIDSLVNGTTILAGDKEFPAFAANSRSDFDELTVHPNLYGQGCLAALHAQALSRIIDGTAAGQLTTDRAAVTAQKANILTSATILGVQGTYTPSGGSAGLLRGCLGLSI
ncbi:MAG: SGNH/GDSL hydrolase family protein [Thermoguttaceae bacterium]